MSEEVARIPEKVEKVDENVVENATPEAAPVLAPKKMGRPAGAKDRAPRKKKITIVEEPLAVVETQPERAESPKRAPPQQKAPPPIPVVELAPEPRAGGVRGAPEGSGEAAPSPRTVLREASRNILELKRLESSARKTNLREIYSRGLRGL